MAAKRPFRFSIEKAVEIRRLSRLKSFVSVRLDLIFDIFEL